MGVVHIVAKKRQNGKMAKVIRNCILNGEKIGENAFNIYRGYIFGNPYTHIRNKETKALVKVKTRDEAIAMYDKYFDAMIADEGEAGKRFRQAFDELYEAYKKFDVIYLNCYCREDESCHGDIIRKKLIQRSMKEKISNVRKP